MEQPGFTCPWLVPVPSKPEALVGRQGSVISLTRGDQDWCLDWQCPILTHCRTSLSQMSRSFVYLCAQDHTAKGM